MSGQEVKKQEAVMLSSRWCFFNVCIRLYRLHVGWGQEQLVLLLKFSGFSSYTSDTVLCVHCVDI